MPIQSIVELPFRERDPFALLNLAPGAPGDPGRASPDLDYAGYGYARVRELWLATHDDPGPLSVRDVLLLALHTPDDADVHDGDLLLELEVGADDDDGYAVHVMLSRFLAIWLPRISRDERAIVLAVCNPHHTRVVRPPGLRGVTMYHPLGDVTSWRDEPADFLAGPGALRLLADGWRAI
jgi:hypothetical protein